MGRPKTASKTVIDKEFAARVERGCKENPLIPAYNYGRLGYIHGRLQQDHGVVVSRETIRKWLAGESRPRHKSMSALAEILEVDEAWLAFGRTPEGMGFGSAPQVVHFDGAVCYVAGLLGLNGASIAFADVDKTPVHFHAISDGKHRGFHVALARGSDRSRFVIPGGFADLTVVGLVPRSDRDFDIYRLTKAAIGKYGLRKGSHVELTAVDHGAALLAKTEECPKIERIADLLL